MRAQTKIAAVAGVIGGRFGIASHCPGKESGRGKEGN